MFTVYWSRDGEALGEEEFGDNDFGQVISLVLVKLVDKLDVSIKHNEEDTSY